MKLLISLIFIILASSTYRCGKGEDTIDCNTATAQMEGVWNGKLLYSGPEGRISSATGQEIPTAVGVTHNFTLEVTSINECIFNGKITYGSISNNTVYEISGNIDKYGWVTFTEQEFITDGKIFTDCGDPNVINNGSICNYWPTGRWRVGGIFSKGRFTNDPLLEWEGEFRLPTSGYSIFTGNSFSQVAEITGNYEITKQ